MKGKGKQMRKVSIALFICCVTRAVHLELVENLSTDTFKRCLRGFIARRGVPTLMVSDNTKTFKGIEEKLCILHGHLLVREEQDKQRIQWHFNLERAPLWGGLFETMIESMKRCLRKGLGNAVCHSTNF